MVKTQALLPDFCVAWLNLHPPPLSNIIRVNPHIFVFNCFVCSWRWFGLDALPRPTQVVAVGQQAQDAVKLALMV